MTWNETNRVEWINTSAATDTFEYSPVFISASPSLPKSTFHGFSQTIPLLKKKKKPLDEKKLRRLMWRRKK